MRYLVLALGLLSGCAASTRAELIRPARVAVSEAADVLARAQETELLRLRLAVMTRAMACDKTNATCLDRAVEAGFEDEKENVSRMVALSDAQRDLARAIQAFDACSEAAEPAEKETCQARTFAALRPLLPKAQALTEALRKATQ